MSLLIFNSVRLMQEATEASLEVMVEQNASMLHALATAYGEQRRFEAMQDVLGELLLDANEGLVYVRIVDADGVALVTAGMPQMRELPEAQRSPTLQRGNGSQHLIHIRTPLLLEGNTVGFLQFGVSASVLAIAQQAIFRQGAMIALAEIILTLLLLSSIGYLLTRNLRRLLDGSLALTEGRLAHRIPEKGNDELSDLAKRFNLMADSLQARIDELDQTASKLRGSEERYALAMKGANDGLWDWDIPAKTLYVSQRFSDIFGLPQGASKISQDEIPKRMNPAELDSRREQLIAHLKGYSNQFKTELQVTLPDGQTRWALVRGVALRGENGRAYRMAGSISDIHLQKLAEEQLVHDAFHDKLTSLPNRALFMEHLGGALGRRATNRRFVFAVLTINLERFHLVNDSFGHAAGDELLREVGDRISRTVRRGDIVARIGGDQFAVLANDIGSEEEGLRIAELLREAISAPARIGNDAHAFFPKVHIGVALVEDHDSKPESLLRDSDNALHEAKRSGDSAVAVFHASMHSKALRTLKLEADLRNAMLTRGIDIHLQPIVSLADQRLSSFEALARWVHPELGILLPEDFIPIAETRGLIQQVSLRTVQQACKVLKKWREAQPERPLVPISINLSAVQLANPALVHALIERAQDTGLPPDCLRFEITESVLADLTGSAQQSVDELRNAGFQIMIDDFGTGYSALSYLHSIPCDLIKFDGAFIRRIADDERLRTIVQHSIELAHDLGMKVIAEWIEDERQLVILRDLGCDYGQGYLFGKPMQTGQAHEMWLARGEGDRD